MSLTSFLLSLSVTADKIQKSGPPGERMSLPDEVHLLRLQSPGICAGCKKPLCPNGCVHPISTEILQGVEYLECPWCGDITIPTRF